MMAIAQLEQIAIAALRKAYQVHEQLGAEGEEPVQKNQFGDTALKMDIEAEKAVIGALREAQSPIRPTDENLC